MASAVSNVNNSAMSSIYGNRNVLSGLASGMDTESMIENAVSGIKTKITTLQKKRTSLEWQQEAYRSIIDKMVSFNNKYMSYTSSTNLLSSSFFDKATTITPGGTNASKVTATGKSTSQIILNSISQLATAARYAVSGSALTGSDGVSISAGTAVDLTQQMDVSTMTGSMTLNYGNKTTTINFDELEIFTGADGKPDPQKLADAITKKLDDQKIVTGTGESVSASSLIGVTVEGGSIKFTDKKNAGNEVSISGASSAIQGALGLTISADNKPTSIILTDANVLTRKVTTAEYLQGKEINLTLDKTSKKIKLPSADEIAAYKTSNPGATDAQAFTGALQTKVDAAFGKLSSGESKVKVSNLDATGNTLKLNFNVAAGSSLHISSQIGAALGMENTETSYVNLSRKLSALKGPDGNSLLNDAMALKNPDGTFKTDSEGKKLYSFQLNGVEIGQYTEDTALETVLRDVRSNTEANVDVSFSQTTNQFVFTSKNTGASGGVEFGGGLAQAMFGNTKNADGSAAAGYTAGQDAIFTATINGQKMELTRSSNNVDLDGMSMTLQGTFTEGSGDVTFTTKSDADKIVGAIKSMVEDYNAMVKEIREQFSTTPLQSSKGKKYEPLTEEDKASMSESAVAAYEKNAKKGLLFADRDLSSLYEKLRSSISPTGNDGSALREMGISTTYSQGLTTISLDENKLRGMLESNPDAVKDAFTKSKDADGASTNGLMQSLKKQMDQYASVTGATKGILVQKAGTTYSSLSLLKNTLQSNMSTIDAQITKWETKMSDQIDRYTSKFTQLEKLISQMNSQSSALSGMMGG